MSWFSVPLPNPFKVLQFSDDEIEPDPEAQQPSSDTVSPSAGVKDDLSAIGETIGRQLRGVAAFLAPPPADDSAGDGTSQKLAGIRNDLAEIGGSLKTSLSLLSSNRAVSEISKLASNLLQLNEETELGDDDRPKNDNGGDGDGDYEGEDEYEGAGITDEVIEFAAKISNRPELWTDFPLAFEQEFDLSDAQSEHVSIIEQLVPSLADLRSRLISDMSEKQFWLIYFILLLPRLNEDDLELLSTPEIVEARETLLRMLRSKNETEVNSQNPQSDDSSNVDSKVEEEMEKSQSLEKVTMSENSAASRSTEINESDAPKNLVVGTDNQADPKAGGAEQVLGGNPDVLVVKEEHENTEIWLEEPRTTRSSSAPKRFQSEDDVSFSDLEDDDTDLPNRRARSTRASSPEGSSEWVQLNKGAGIRGSQSRAQLSSRDRDSEGEESSDWLTVDDFDP